MTEAEQAVLEYIRVALGGLYTLNSLAEGVHQLNSKWWTDLETGKYPIERNKGEMIALMHSELSEMLEGVRKNTMDDHLAHRLNEHVEAADLLIRLLDYCGGHGIPLGEVFLEKLEYNLKRKDHSHEHRKTEGGKKF